MRIIEGELSSAAVVALLNQHLQRIADHSPPESVHALDLQALSAPDVTFWTAWDETELCGCGALKELDARHGEIKSMRTANAHLRKRVASAILRHIIDVARGRSYSRLSLETGSGAAFAPAHSLYEKFGFVDCAPFGDYDEDPFSTFMTLEFS